MRSLIHIHFLTIESSSECAVHGNNLNLSFMKLTLFPSYFILSGLFQFLVTFVDQDKIATTLPLNVCSSPCSPPSLTLILSQGEESSILTIHSQFPKYQEYYTVIIHNQEVANKTTGKLYVGKYFTEEGEFDQIGFANDIKKLLKLFQQKKYSEVEFNHKSRSKAD